MKHALCVMLFTMSVVCVAQTENQSTELSATLENIPTKRGGGIDEKTRNILAQFANIVMGFLGIVQDPNNAANVKDRVTEMVGNAVNIVTEAVKKGQLSLDATEEEVEEFAKEAIAKKWIIIE